MPFTASLPTWNNPGQKPPDSTMERGWGAGEYPPADWFNWQWYTAYKALDELQRLAATSADLEALDGRTASKTDFDNHNKDATRHITAAERTTWNGKETPTGAQTKVDTHANRKDNPHQVTSQQVTTIAALDGAVSGDSYPIGLTVFDATNLTGYPTLFGVVVTNKINNSRMSQWFFEHAYNDTQVGVYLRHWHTTPARWTPWVRIETTEGAQSKADQAETNAKSYTDGKVRGGKIQSGRVTVSIPGNSLKTTTVTFPEGFSGTPVVTASINNSLSPDKYPAPTIGVVTTTSFQITGQNTSSGALTFDYGWIAMG